MPRAMPSVPPCSASPESLDAELSALVHLLANCAGCPCNAACARLALDHLEIVSSNPHAGQRLRQTAARLACQWQADAQGLQDERLPWAVVRWMRH